MGSGDGSTKDIYMVQEAQLNPGESVWLQSMVVPEGKANRKRLYGFGVLIRLANMGVWRFWAAHAWSISPAWAGR